MIETPPACDAGPCFAECASYAPDVAYRSTVRTCLTRDGSGWIEHPITGYTRSGAIVLGIGRRVQVRACT